MPQHFAQFPRGRYHAHRITQKASKARSFHEHVNYFFSRDPGIFDDLSTNSLDFLLNILAGFERLH